MQGRTGNALFEIASGVAIAAHYKLDVCLYNLDHYIESEVLPLLERVPETCSDFVLKRMKFGDKVDISNHCCVFEDFSVSGNEKRMSLMELFGNGLGNGKIYNLVSYLQSWKYLQLAPKMAEIHLKQQVISSARKYLETIVPQNKRVAIHLRLTDASGPQHMYNFPGPEYFQKAMQYFLDKWDRHGSVKFLVFSDNPTWCRKQSLFDGEHISIIDETSVRKNDFTLMSACDGVIQSVGTFGWWAGHFSSQVGGEVVYFKNNFNLKQVKAMGEVVVEEEYFPPNWIGIKAPALDRRGKWVQDMEGDVLPKHLNEKH